MAQFKPFHEFQYTGIVFRLHRDGNTARSSLQASKRGRIFIRYRAQRSEGFLFRSTYVSSEVTVKFIILWICDRSSQQ